MQATKYIFSFHTSPAFIKNAKPAVDVSLAVPHLAQGWLVGVE